MKSGGPIERSVLKTRSMGVAGIVLVAIAADFAIELALDRPGGPLEIVGRAISFALGAGLFYLVGRFLGNRTWPKHGTRLTRRLLRRSVRERRVQPLVVLTDRPDVTPSPWRRILEVTGFAAGSSVLLGAVLSVLGADPNLVRGLASLFALLALWGAFILVPYWAYGMMGLRQVDPVRWTITPLSRRYAGRLKLSNGALALIAVGAAFNLAFRAGASQDEALTAGVRAVATVAASVLVIAASAVAHYSTRERALVKTLEAEALTMGIKDARGLTDGEFLPRVDAERAAR